MPAMPLFGRLLITLGLVVLIIVLSVTPGRNEPGDTGFVWLIAVTPKLLQKIMHFAVYASLALLWSWSLDSVDPKWLRIAAAFVLAVGLGIALEWAQTMVPGRFGTLTDVLLNSAGALAGALAASLVFKG
jgi:glycopeptide antibiotics resistance protein